MRMTMMRTSDSLTTTTTTTTTTTARMLDNYTELEQGMRMTRDKGNHEDDGDEVYKDNKDSG